VITEINIKICCNTVHAVNFRRELVLENATSGSLKILIPKYSGDPEKMC